MKKVLVHICGVCLWYCERLAFYTLGCRLFNHAQCMPLILLSFKIACLFHYIKKDYAYKVVKSLSMHEWATLTFSKKSARWEPFAKFGERERSTLRPKRLVSTFVQSVLNVQGDKFSKKNKRTGRKSSSISVQGAGVIFFQNDLETYLTLEISTILVLTLVH